MQLVLGVAVADSVARLALVDASDPLSTVDRFEVRLPADSTDQLVRTVVDTDTALNTDGHQLLATSICGPDDIQTDRLRSALTRAGVGNVSVVSAADAATAFVRGSAGSAGEPTSALLLVDDATAALSVVGPDAATTCLVDIEEVPAAGSDAACTAMIERLREEPGGAQTLYVLSVNGDSAALTDRVRPSAPIPVHTAPEPAYLLARGAAAAAAETAAASSREFTAPSPVMGEHLAYSMAEDSGSIPIGIAEEYGYASNPLQTPMAPLSGAPTGDTYADDPREVDQAGAAARPRVLLVGSTIAAVVVVGFAVLAVGVAIGIKPSVSQQAVRDPEAVPGKYLPPMPGQGIEPVEDATAYLPPVVPVSATPPQSGTPAVYTSGQRGSTSNGYAPSAGSVGGAPLVIVGGAAPANPVVGAVANPPVRITDWLSALPDNLTINFAKPQWAMSCTQGQALCFLQNTGCYPNRPGTLDCLVKAGLIGKPDSVDPPGGCTTDVVGASCTPQPLDNSVPDDGGTATVADPEGPGGTDDPGQQVPEGSGGSTAAVAPVTDTPVSSETSKPAGPTTDTPVPSTTETPSPTTTRTTTPSAPRPTETTRPPVTTVTTQAPRPIETSEPEPPPPPPPVIEAPEPPPVVEAPEPPPAAVEAPAPAPAPVVEAPAPAPAPAPVVTQAPAPPPVSSSDSDSGSSSSSGGSSSSDSGSSSSDSSPTTTEVLAP